MKPVAILGGGITGLTAAFALHKKGVPFVLYESSGRVGGAIRSHRENGYLAEWGPSAILETSPAITALISELGLERCNATPGAAKNYIVRYMKPNRVPHSLFSFLNTPLFSPAAKLRLTAEPIIPAKRGPEDEALADFVVRRVGHEFLDYAINPLVSGIYAGDPARLSVRYGFPKLKAVEEKYGSLILGQVLGARERRKRQEVSKQSANKVSFQNGLQALTDALHQRLGAHIVLDAATTRLAKEEEVWRVTCEKEGREESQLHSALLFAAPAHRIATMRLEGVQLETLAGIEHPSVAVVALGFRRQDVADPLDGYGFLVPKAEQLSMLGTTYSSTVFQGRAPEGHVLLTSYIGGCRSPELAEMAPDQLIEHLLKDLRRLLGISGHPTFTHHTLIRKAIPQYNLGHEKFLNFMTETESRWPGLFFAGNYRNGISLSDSIVSGLNVAERIGTFVSSTIL